MSDDPSQADLGHPDPSREPSPDYLANTAAMFDVTPQPTTLLPPPRRRAPGAMVLATAFAVALVLIGGSFTAIHLLNGSQADPAEAAPASTFAIVQVDLDPSASQKLGIYRFSKRFPKSPTAHKGTSKGVVDTLLSAMLESADTGLSYRKDVKPWLGDAAAFAAYTGSDGKVKPMAILGYKDRDAAKKALAKASENSDSGYTFLDNWIILAPSQPDADDAAAATRKGTLAKSGADYRDDLDALQGSPVITAWADLTKGFAAVQSQFGSILEGFGGFPGATSETTPGAPAPAPSLDPSLLPKGRVAMGVSVDNDVAQLEATAFTDQTTEMKGSTDAARYVRHMPKGTTVAVAAGDLRPAVRTFFKQLDKTPFADEINQGISQAEKESGLSLPEDLLTVMGNAVAVSYEQSGQNIAVRAHPDRSDDARKVIDKIANLAADGDAPLDTQYDGRDVILSLDASYGRAVAHGSGLTDSELFHKAVGSVPDSLQMLAFVDLSELLADQGETAQHFRAAGMLVDSSDGRTSMVLRVVVR